MWWVLDKEDWSNFAFREKRPRVIESQGRPDKGSFGFKDEHHAQELSKCIQLEFFLRTASFTSNSEKRRFDFEQNDNRKLVEERLPELKKMDGKK